MRPVLFLSLALGLSVSLPALADRYHWYHQYQLGSFPGNPEALIQNWYERYLNREPDPDGMANWVGALRSGQSPEAVLAGILSSDEYYARTGNSPEGFIQRLYTDVVGRSPSPQEFSYWMSRLFQSGRQDGIYALLRRYPQSWNSESYYPDDYRYDYRRPGWPYRR